MKKIESLTKEQTDLLSVYRDKWLEIGLKTGRADRAAAEQAAKDAYAVAGLPPPKIFVWTESPIGGLLAARLLKEFSKKYPQSGESWDSVRASVKDSVWASVGDSVGVSVGDSVGVCVGDSVWDSVGASVETSVRTSVGASVWDSVWASVGDSVWDSVGASVGASVWGSVWDSVWDSVRDSGLRDEWNDLWFCGQYEAGWLGFYDYFNEVLKIESCKKLEPLSRLSKEVGWTWLYQNAVIFSERPSEIHLTMQGSRHVLHNENGPAIKWGDGYELYRLNGVQVTKEIVETPADKFTKEMVLGQENVEVRREIFRKIGINNFLDKIGGKTIHKFKDYELIEVDFEDGKRRVGLKMLNPSLPGVYHFERVSDDVKTCQEALAWRNQTKNYIEPVALT